MCGGVYGGVWVCGCVCVGGVCVGGVCVCLFVFRAAWSLDFPGSQFMLLAVCGWIVMEKKMSPIHWTIVYRCKNISDNLIKFNPLYLCSFMVLTIGSVAKHAENKLKISRNPWKS